MGFDDFKKNVLLAPYTSLRVGGVAEYFFEAKSSEELKEALTTATQKKIHVTVLGGGQNVLVADKGVKGLVVLVRFKKITIEANTVYAEAGVALGELLAKVSLAGLSGFEWAGGLPGTVGGAIFGNAGTFGHAIGELVEYVEVLDTDLLLKKISQEECEFGYRTSVFKSALRGHVITGAKLRLQRGEISDVQKELRERVLWRSKHHPPYHSAGCIFKNPAEEHYHRVSFDAVDAEGKPVEWFGRVPAGWLIDRAGLKGMVVGGAKVSEVHANFVTNAKNATAEDVITLISIIKERVHRKFGVLLQEEVQYLGFK